MHKRLKKLRKRRRRIICLFEEQSGLYELLRTLFENKMGLETPFERKFKDYFYDKSQLISKCLFGNYP